MRRLQARRSLYAGAFALSCCVLAGPASGQGREAEWVQDLPRPGYEPRTLRPGSFVMSPVLRLSAVADSNIFAQAQNEIDDVIFRAEPRLGVSRQTEALTLSGEAYGDFRRNADVGTEDLDLYGVAGQAKFKFTNAHQASLAASFDRTYERRDDPDANDDVTLPPTLINAASGEAGYSWRPGRLGLVAKAGVARADYLDAADDDRDMTSYLASARGLVAVSSRIDGYAEVFGVRRDFRLDLDRTGVDRDARTLGVNAGVAFDITDKLVGEIGAGVFDSEPQDPTLSGFSGVSAQARVRWSPRARTGVLFSAFRGDVATIRSGASGREDTRLSLEVIQEIRHNLRARAGVGYRHARFRTAAGQEEDDLTFRAGVEYLLNRHVALEANYVGATRSATLPTDEFDVHRAGLALVLRY